MTTHPTDAEIAEIEQRLKQYGWTKGFMSLCAAARDRNRLEAENAKLRGALKPLAKAAGQTPIMVGRGENTRPHTPLDSAAFENWSGAVTWGMLRAARRALSQLETDNG